MAHNILLTSLYSSGTETEIRYFKVKDGHRNYYCDAILTVEASAKYALATYPIDEIITLGRKLTFDEGDDGRLIRLDSGSDFYTSEIGELSDYSLLRYRIAQYIDELRIEQRDIKDRLSEEEQKKVKAFIQKYFNNMPSSAEHRRFNRLFEELTEEPGAFACLCKAMEEEIPEAMADPVRFQEWTKNYLYSEMKDSAKLEMLRENEAVMVRFIPTSLGEDGKMPIDNMHQLVQSIISDHDEVNLYVALNNDDLTDNFVLLNVLDMVRVMPRSGVDLVSILTTSVNRTELVGEITDSTEVYGITELVAAMRSFLQYGKVDMMVDFWERSGAHNERLESMIYAMRRIDVGISLCDIQEIERGIEGLRHLFAGGTDLGGSDYYSRIYSVIAEAIVRDYGPLISKDEIEFIDLVKWTANKKFYQQTLTLIESRAPEAFVRYGIFYPCDDEEQKEKVIRLFAEMRNDLRPFELYMMDDMDHYFIKLYGRRMAPKGRGDRQKIYTEYRIGQLDNEDPGIITAHTATENRETLKNLLYAYYHLGDVRNMINHARDNGHEEERLIVDQRDIPSRMASIREAIDFFLINYDKIMEEISGKEPKVVPISSLDVKIQAKRIQEEKRADERKEENHAEH